MECATLTETETREITPRRRKGGGVNPSSRGVGGDGVKAKNIHIESQTTYISKAKTIHTKS